MKSKSLKRLYKEHQGKVSDKWSLYLSEYEGLFEAYRSNEISILEIGIQNGGSLEIYGKYFSNARKIVGCDIDPACSALTFDDSRITVIVGDANSSDVEHKIIEMAPSFDLIIDDGSHLSSDIVCSFARYFAHLHEGGLYIVEDLHCSYWQEFAGGLFNPYAALSFFKRLTDIINHEHWGVNKTRTELLASFTKHFGIDFNEDLLAQIHSIEFVNSMCVIRKNQVKFNVLGKQFIAGNIELVCEGRKELHGQFATTLDQSENPWTDYSAPVEELVVEQNGQISRLKQTIIERDVRIDSLNQTLNERDAQVASLNQTLNERDAQLASFGQALHERDIQIASLNQTLYDKNVHINNLSKILAERDGQIAGLDQTLAERDARIVNLNQAVAERDGQIARLNQAVAERDGQIARLNQAVAERDGQIAALYHSADWRLTSPVRFVGRQLLRIKIVLKALPYALSMCGGYRGLIKHVWSTYNNEGIDGIKLRVLFSASPGAPPPVIDYAQPNHNDYNEWVCRYDTLTDRDREKIKTRISHLHKTPLISVVMPVYNSKPEWLIEAIESVRKQIYPYWELCIADDASTDKVIRPILERYTKEDSRIKVVFRERNSHISVASNSALELVTGEWVVLLDHDDLLSEHALFWVADSINQNPDVRLIYSDEDKIDEVGRRFEPYFKCEWNVDLFYSHNIFSHLGVYYADLLYKIGGFREGLEGSQDYDLALRCVERIEPKQIHHIPRVLYHWRLHDESTAQSADAKPYAVLAGERALNEHFQRQKINGRIELVGHGYRVRYALPDIPPMVSLIIPTRNGLQLIRQCVGSILKTTTYQNFEILIVDNGSDDPATLRYLDQLRGETRVRVVRDDRPFNFSALNNAAVKLAQGEMLGLLNNDLEVISPEWLSEMVSIALQPRVGAVGAKLWYPNDTLQHGGVILGVGGVANHAHLKILRGMHDYFGRASLIQSFSAVTAACLVIRKAIYEQVGGLNETDLQIAFNDIDFCLRVREAGYRNVWTPYAELYHHESATRGFENTPEKQLRFRDEVLYMQKRWGDLLLNDPAYSPNLTLDYANFSLAWPPRINPI